MDRYAYDLISALRGRVEFTVIEEGLHSDLGWLWNEMISPSYVLKVARSDADVYHAVSHFGAKNAVIARKSPVVATIHDLIPNDVPLSPDYYRIHPARRRWMNPVYWSFLKRCDHLIATSKSAKTEAVRILKVDPDKISVVNYCVDSSRFKPIARDDYHNPKRLLYIGALDRGKGILNLIQAFYLVTKKVTAVELLVGGRGKELPAATKLVTYLGIRDKVKFLGFVPNEKLAYYYSVSDLFVFPSYYGFHLMDLDAMASGLPVIAGNIRDAPEYVGNSGLLVNPWEIADISQAIIRLLTDSGLYTQMSRHAISRAREFSPELMASRTFDTYRRVASDK
jgi:glycosyltransferase involved in cell wall biosynthesis